MKRTLSYLLKPFIYFVRKKYFLFGLNGFLIAFILFCYAENSYESKLFKVLMNNVTEGKQLSSIPHDSILIRSLHLVHFLEERRSGIFANNIQEDWKSKIFSPITDDLITARGGCGSYAMVLARLLEQMDIPMRVVQMEVNGTPGGHILVEAKSGNGWVVLDPTYDQYYRKDDNTLASFQDVSADWAKYSKQVGADYNMGYNYAAARYTNWDKVPVLMPAIKSVLNVFIGSEKADQISIRSLAIRKFQVLMFCSLALLLVLNVFLVKRYIGKFKDLYRHLAMTLFRSPGHTASPSI